ncbi:mannose-1-phosphate guanylyltransferase/mannose-6-phosphate isomerase [Aquisalimonas lutea]|uniref:mannose-1-phosphate guanylyltransferase/mannose-6-phosphate isomerase n=1 Tax=Aquisalimonas lutea TaxID=1327750 RepID=UPI0025B32D27|nr:mannose-1-phosphate guanylyltransferase/mannose-6-phosphate isomerase [Aquisalimonas lutea]MDN3518901.1 mannose-1-phosphate guanylyltransferase/mannose-6-phosphate isomerase [Aquisalimonas lutea]
MAGITPLVLSGGAGTRLWPLSRELYPKQLLALTEPERTMLQVTADRLHGLPGLADEAVVVCNESHRFLVAEQLRDTALHRPAILLEPVGRNTAPAACAGALHAVARDPEALLLVMPADHCINDPAAFRDAVASGREAARDGALVTFGIRPAHPETGYGYIRARMDGQADAGGPMPVAEFVEKPDADTAQRYVDSGEYFWNSGLFLFRADRYLQELERLEPDMVAACREALDGAQRDLDFIRLEPEAFARCRSDSIDYAVMERTRDAMVIPMDPGWSDLGSWSALQAVSPADADGNVTRGDVITEGSHNSYIRSEHRLVAALGMNDAVIVETADAVLVADRGHVQDVKKVVERLRSQGREEPHNHLRVVRPWGSYESITAGERFQVKRIIVNPGASLSLQMHHHRAEHWVVVRGTARIVRDDQTFLLGEDQSTYIPLGTRHRLENPGKIPLELIEVQTGSYLGEDDIVRFEDVYGRG